MRRTILLAGAITLAAGVARADVTISTVGPMTGQYAIFGEQMRRGAIYMADQINKQGGINGEPIKLEIGDDACDPRQAVAVANQMAVAGVTAVIRPYFSRPSSPPPARPHQTGGP